MREQFIEKKIHGRSEENGRRRTEVCKSGFRWCA